MTRKIQDVNDLSMSQSSLNDDGELAFFTNIDQATKEWLKSLNHMWQLWKGCDGVMVTLTDYFESAPNPYLSTLRILVNILRHTYVKVHSSLAFTVIDEFAKWLKPQKEKYQQFLTRDIKLATFQLIIKRGKIELIEKVSDTYELIKDKEEFHPIIQKMIEEKKYKEAAQYAAILQLQDCFSEPETLVLPLILQNKLPVVEHFLTNCPNLQESIAIYLDSLIKCDSNMHILLNDIIVQYEIPDVKMSTIQTRPMTKLIARFIKLYDLPPELCPNLNKKRCKSALQFLIHKRYVDCSLSIDSWREMVEETVGNDQTLQFAMMRLLVNAKDASEGLYWAKKFNIPKEQWPSAIWYEDAQNKYQGLNEGASSSKMHDWEDTDDRMKYHELKLSRDSIKVIDNPRRLKEFLDFGLKGVSIVGIDIEWKPCFGIRRTELALIQIATEANVYIVDVTTLGNESAEMWSEFSLTLFENKSILKLGFGIAQDMTFIRNSLAELCRVKTHRKGYLDIAHLWKKLVDDYKFVFPYETDENLAKKSLSALVKLCLGVKLNKSDQFSNWEHRPLRESQILYAALDAYCLLEIYTILETQCKRLDIPFHDVCLEVQHIPH